jgi:hypothetical protein
MKAILTKAYTGSEWDGVSFAIIPLTAEQILFLKQEATKVPDDALHVEYSGDNAEFFAGVKEDTPDEFNFEPEEGEPEIVELPDDYEKYFDRPEQTIKYGGFKLTKEDVCYTAYGKHTDEEYWTDDIKLEILDSLS